MIVTGNKEMFAIAAEVIETPNNWLLGRLRFVFHGQTCGNWNDETDLRGCYGWLKDFAEKPRRRFEPGLLELTPMEVFDRLVRPVQNRDEGPVVEYYDETFSRFHISHLGMSSFDKVVMVLVEGPKAQRCLWQEGDESIHDDVFPSGHMQQVTLDFCRLVEREAMAIGVAL